MKYTVVVFLHGTVALDVEARSKNEAEVQVLDKWMDLPSCDLVDGLDAVGVVVEECLE